MKTRTAMYVDKRTGRKVYYLETLRADGETWFPVRLATEAEIQVYIRLQAWKS